jgi:spore coat protein U-like protein
MYNSKLAFASLALVLTGVVSARGQGVNGSITATAQVQAPITVTGTQNLSFGNVFPGAPKAVAYTDAANGGKFSVAGQASTPVTYSFTLPVNLTSGGNNLPIGSWLGYESTINSTSGGSAITPSAAPSGTTLSGSGALFFFVGATVTPPANQPAGSYTGTVTLTVSY